VRKGEEERIAAGGTWREAQDAAEAKTRQKAEVFDGGISAAIEACPRVKKCLSHVAGCNGVK
jgi:hypothetical protein